MKAILERERSWPCSSRTAGPVGAMASSTRGGISPLRGVTDDASPRYLRRRASGTQRARRQRETSRERAHRGRPRTGAAHTRIHGPESTVNARLSSRPRLLQGELPSPASRTRLSRETDLERRGPLPRSVRRPIGWTDIGAGGWPHGRPHPDPSGRARRPGRGPTKALLPRSISTPATVPGTRGPHEDFAPATRPPPLLRSRQYVPLFRPELPGEILPSQLDRGLGRAGAASYLGVLLEVLDHGDLVAALVVPELVDEPAGQHDAEAALAQS